MPRYRVTSGEHIGFNGNAPYSKHVWARKPEDAAWKAITIGTGKIIEITPVDYDHENLTYVFLVRTSANTSFRVVVQETFNFGFWKIFR